MNASHSPLLLILFLYLTLPSLAQDLSELQPGKDRWSVKTSAPHFKPGIKAKEVPLRELMQLPLLDRFYDKRDNTRNLIPQPVDGLTEGEIITTTGYLSLVALENSENHTDGDYHIQLTLRPGCNDSCFIVEIPYEKFVPDPLLSSLCQENRHYVKKYCLDAPHKEPSTKGKMPDQPIKVQVTGQLFYDAIHARTMRNPDLSKRHYRGKKGDCDFPVHSYTAWEIHPVTSITIIPETATK